MSDMTEQTDLTPNGIDRRSALKKVAVGGAVAWTVPMVLSSKVSAQEEACTLKCQPVGGVEITANVTVAACDPPPGGDPPPGDQPVNGIITSITAEAGSCGCGGTATVTLVDPLPNSTFEIRPQPGNLSAQFTVDVQLTCLDRQDRPVTQSCSITFTDVGNPGSCQARGGQMLSYTGTAACGAAVC